MSHNKSLSLGDIVLTHINEQTPFIVLNIPVSPNNGLPKLILCCSNNAYTVLSEQDIHYRLGTTLGSKIIPDMPVFHIEEQRIFRIISFEQNIRRQSYTIGGKTKKRPYHTEKIFLLQDINHPNLNMTAPERLLIPLHVPSKILTRWEQVRTVKNPLQTIFHRIK